jgi:hypothetical protein
MESSSRKAYWALLIAAVLCAGCTTRPLHRGEIQNLQGTRLVRVVTPALEVPTFMQAAVSQNVLGGALPYALATSAPKLTLRPPEIIDVTGAFVQAFTRQLPSKAPWWPAAADLGEAVPANYVHRGGPWIRVEITQYRIAPAPLKTLHMVVHFSLRTAGAMDDTHPYWSKVVAYSGAVHGGEKIADNDLEQINRELRRGAQWLADQVLTAMAEAADMTPGAVRSAAAAVTAPASIPAAAAPARPASDYTGTLRCGAFEGTGRVESPGPWAAPVRVSIQGGRATMQRGDDKYSESLSGSVVGDHLVLEGRGAMHATPTAYWLTKVSGRFQQEGGRFDGSAQIADSRGNVFRRCSVDLVARP